jgi:hypothetical protein
MEIVPKSPRSDHHQEYVWVVTPPYHFWNPRDLDTSYGVSAQESVRMSPREFNFVLDEEQYKNAAQLVDLAVSSHLVSENKSKEEYEKDGQAASEALMRFPVAKGRLWIVDSKIVEATKLEKSGSISWIRFRVELRVLCDFPATASSSDVIVDTSACEVSKKTRMN